MTFTLFAEPKLLLDQYLKTKQNYFTIKREIDDNLHMSLNFLHRRLAYLLANIDGCISWFIFIEYTLYTRIYYNKYIKIKLKEREKNVGDIHIIWYQNGYVNWFDFVLFMKVICFLYYSMQASHLHVFFFLLNSKQFPRLHHML